jgi:hypothetical protein
MFWVEANYRWLMSYFLRIYSWSPETLGNDLYSAKSYVPTADFRLASQAISPGSTPDGLRLWLALRINADSSQSSCMPTMFLPTARLYSLLIEAPLCSMNRTELTQLLGKMMMWDKNSIEFRHSAICARAIAGDVYPTKVGTHAARLRHAHEHVCYLQHQLNHVHDACQAMYRVQHSWQQLSEACHVLNAELDAGSLQG